MSYVLRDYQQKASDAAVSFFNNKAKKTNAIMVLPTGSGKSLIIADIAQDLTGIHWYSSRARKLSNRTSRNFVLTGFSIVAFIPPPSIQKR